jgi:hypothetical protein
VTSTTDSITEFLRAIGIEVVEGDVGEDAFLPGIVTRDGRLVVDPDRLTYPGDLLHEAGHLAVVSPGERQRFGAPGGDEGLDMGRVELRAVAWSFAAAVHLGLDSAVVFHDGGYRGHAAGLRATFAAGVYPGASALEEVGLTLTGARAVEAGVAPYPHLVRWVRG